MITLNKDQAMLLHKTIYERYGGAYGVLDDGMLDSALKMPFATYVGEELIHGDKEKIVRLAYCLIKDHPFRDGNKRIGALVLLTLLKLNGYPLKTSDNDLTEMIMDVAASRRDDTDLLRWVNSLCENAM